MACDSDFCIDKTNGAYFCDPADSASYYRCEFGKARHFTCGPGTLYDGFVCNFPQQACITNPVPDASPGTVINGICEATAESGNTATTTTTGGAASIGTTVATGATLPSSTAGDELGIVWQLYRRHRNMKSACGVSKDFLVATPILCGSACSITGGCTGFNLYRSPSNVVGGKRYVCELLTCLNDHLLSSIAGQHYYDQI
ncbi:uncharacterized protein [Haliotis cracherodii]|uniref:uncharacterized protein n=1 Tax=Haliotis cracherodii TaxID=6455 RepID=UPI0039EBCFB9